ncbi:MAG: sulfatase family protein [Polyangiales bacterium]
MSSLWRERVRRGAELLFGGPTIGALWLLLLTAWAFAGGDDDRVQGVRATPIVDLARKHFGADVRALTFSLVATAIALGAALGLAAELAILARRTFRGGLATTARRTLARVVLVVGLHLTLFCWGVARMPQLYAEKLYLQSGPMSAWARTGQIVIADVLRPHGVLAIAAFFLVLWAAPYPDLAWLRRRWPVLAGAVLAVALVGFATRIGGGKTSARHGGPPNVVILAVDSLRDDRMVPSLAPNLSGVGKDGVRFSRAYVTLPRTLPSWTTILTGKEPHDHGLRTMFPRYEDRARDLSALPARLATLGYHSGVVGDYAADIFTRVRYGFGEVDAPTFNFHALIATRALSNATPLLPLLHSRIGRRVLPAMRELNQAADPRMVSEDALRMLDKLDDGKNPFLLTVFWSTVHFPYAAPSPYYDKFTDPAYRGRFRYHKPNVLGQEGALDPSDVKQVRALYDGAVASVDDAAGVILAELERRGLGNDTIVVVTADHGEMLYDDGHGQGHGDHLFGDQVVHVPLAMKVPARFGAVPHASNDLVRDVDLAPTLLDLAGAHPTDMAGRSLRPLLAAQSLAPKPVFAETEVWMTESIPELPSGGDKPLRIPYPNVALLTELDPRLAYDVVMRPEAEPIVIAAKHRMILEGDLKLVYVPTRRGVRWFLFDRATDPAEVVDLSGSRPDDMVRLRGELFRWMLGDRAMEEQAGMLLPRGTPQSDAGGGFALRVP